VINNKPTNEELIKWKQHLQELDDEKYPIAIAAVMESKEKYTEGEAYTSVYFLQRKVRVGYSQGQRLIERMVQDNILQPEIKENYIRYKIR
jgi:hypothetical protein